MNVKEYLDQVAYIESVDSSFEDDVMISVYKSKFDGSYITHIGMEDNVKFLADLEITEELTHGVGFSPKDGKWYGWSHRAIYGFTIESTCAKGDLHYLADNPEEMIEDHANFFADISQECAEQARAECHILEDRSGIRILHTPIKIPIAKNPEELIKEIENPGTLDEEVMPGPEYSIIKCGRGAWTAKTMDDAKQMAIDFNEGVS